MNTGKLQATAKTVGIGACLLFITASASSMAVINISHGLAVAAALVVAAINGTRLWREQAPRGSLCFALAFLAIAGMSIVFSKDPRNGLVHFPTLALLILTPLAFLPFVGSPRVSQNLLYALVIGLVIGIAVMVLRGPKPGISAERYSPFMGVMNYAGAMNLLYPLALSQFISAMKAQQRGRSVLTLIILALVTLGSLLNATRVIWLSLAAVTLFLVLINVKTLGWRFWICAGGILLAAVVFFTVFPEHRKRLVPSSTNTATVFSDRVRLALWNDAREKLPRLPLFGLGLGCAPVLRYDAEYNHIGYKEGEYGHYHNTFINTTVEMGFPGLAGLLGLFVPSLLLGVRNLFSPFPARRQWAHLLLALHLAFFIHSMTDTVFEIRSAVALFGFLIVLCWVHLAKDTDGRAEPLA